MAPPSSIVSPKTFEDLQADFCKEDVVVRLINFWEVRNFKKGNILMGLELLLIDTNVITIQAFISANHLFRFKGALKSNTIYKISKFIIRPSKTVYKVSPHKYAITFTNQTTFVEQDVCLQQIDAHKFRFGNFEVFMDIVDKHTELFGKYPLVPKILERRKIS